MKADILAFGSHPDDIELSCGGTLMKAVDEGKKVAIVDLTEGELGTRGNAELRRQEAADAAKIMGVSERINLHMRDGFFVNDEKHQLEIIKMVRHYTPDIVICNAPSDRHPDHGKGSDLVREACFLAGLRKIATTYKDVNQQAFRPRVVFSYLQDQYIKPDFLVDISGYMERRLQAIMAYKSQFHNPDSNEPETYISTPQFKEGLTARTLLFGKYIGVQNAEGFIAHKQIGVRSVFDIL